MTLKVIHLLQGFSSAIRQTFVQYFYQVSTDSARYLSDSWSSSSPVKLHYYGRRIIVTPFVNQQFVLQVVERGRAVQFVEQFSSDVGRRHPSRPAQRPPTITHHAHSTPVDVLFTWPSTCFRGLPFICGRSRSTRQATCRNRYVKGIKIIKDFPEL